MSFYSKTLYNFFVLVIMVWQFFQAALGSWYMYQHCCNQQSQWEPRSLLYAMFLQGVQYVNINNCTHQYILKYIKILSTRKCGWCTCNIQYKKTSTNPNMLNFCGSHSCLLCCQYEASSFCADRYRCNYNRRTTFTRLQTK